MIPTLIASLLTYAADHPAVVTAVANAAWGATASAIALVKHVREKKKDAAILDLRAGLGAVVTGIEITRMPAETHAELTGNIQDVATGLGVEKPVLSPAVSTMQNSIRDKQALLGAAATDTRESRQETAISAVQAYKAIIAKEKGAPANA